MFQHRWAGALTALETMRLGAILHLGNGGACGPLGLQVLDLWPSCWEMAQMLLLWKRTPRRHAWRRQHQARLET